jgi:hypothetical protein
MPIKYGELTIIYNKEEISIFSDFLLWLKYEPNVPNKSKYVFLFEDGEICEINDKLKNLQFKFMDNISSKMPIYFGKKKKFYFYKKPILDDSGKYRLNFKQLFSLYTKYNSSMSIPSCYNGIYYCYKSNEKPEIFGIIRIKSNEYMPRYQFAYDDEEITKEEVIYLINYIFNCKDDNLNQDVKSSIFSDKNEENIIN